MSKPALSLIALTFVASVMTGGPAWADRDHHRFERGQTRGGGNSAWGWGVGLLAGSAILLAASESRRVVATPSVTVYVPPVSPAMAHPESVSQWWYFCARSASYYPHVTYCPSGWEKVPALPPR